MAQTYTYSVSADCPSGQVHVGNLREDIIDAIGSAVLQDITRDGDVLNIIFDVALSVGDKTLLDADTTAPAGGTIANHTCEQETFSENNDATVHASSNVVAGIIPYLGSFAGWNNVVQIKKNDVFYGRLYLGAGTYIGCDYVMGETKTGDVMFGIYADDEGTPPRPTGSLLASGKGAIPVTVTKHRVLFDSPLVLTSGQSVWVAVKSRATDLNVSATSHEYTATWGDVIFAYKTGYTDIDIGALPGSFDANSASALPFFGVVMEGAP